MTTVSVCIPTYNYARFLPDAIESVLSQSYSDFELLVIDNCSTDDTAVVMHRYVTRDPRISYIRNDRNLGLIGNLNRCLELAKNEYLKILCADDLLSPDCLEKSVAVLDRYPQVVLVANARRLVDDSLRLLAIKGYGGKFKCIAGKDVVRKCLVEGNLIGEPSAAMFRNFSGRPVFNEKYSQVMDLEFWFSLLDKGAFAYLPEPLTTFRQHDKQESLSNISSFIFLEDEKKLIQHYQCSKGNLTLTSWERLRWRYRIAYAVWGQRSLVKNKVLIDEKIAEFIPCKFFYLVLPWRLFYSKVIQLVARQRELRDL